MRVTLRCHYLTVPGQHLQVVTGNTVTDLAWTAHGWWTGAAEIDGPYAYRVTDGGRAVRMEAGPPHRLPDDTASGDTVVDRWQDHDPVRRSRRSSLFTRAVGGQRRDVAAAAGPPSGRFTFRLQEPDIPPGWRPAVVGADTTLGRWNPDEAVPLRPAPSMGGSPWWETRCDAGPGPYKYVLVGPEGEVVWEHGDDRLLPATGGPTLVVDEGFRGRPGWRGAGVAVPLFALRGEHSLGVGQFTDIPAFVDWAANAGMSVVQLLPVNDTVKTHDWDDSYPYDPVSVHALHPLYVDVLELPGAENVADVVATLRGSLEDREEVAYEEVMAAKWRLLRMVFDDAAGRTPDADPDFDRFLEAEWEWIGPYSLWCLLRDRHGTPDMTRWGADASFRTDRLAAVRDPQHEDHVELRFHAWIQWHLRRQLDDAAEHAWRRGIALKGDLPIGVSPTSVETWVHPDLFHLDVQTGAPPDDFSDDGQIWGFPTYDWAAMAADGYAWWRRRLVDLARTFDAYRIDHVLGFFRIWEVPADAPSALLGRFRPCLPLSDDEVRGWLGDVDLDDLTSPESGPADVALLPAEDGWHPRIKWWGTSAVQRLPSDVREAFDAMATDFFHARHDRLWRGRGGRALSAVVDATPMLACGEDLGMVPDVVPEVMRDLGLLSLEIERMPKRLGEWRTDPASTPYLSVISTGTHDMPVLRSWWRDNREAAERLWHEVLGNHGAAPSDPPPAVVEQIVAAQLASPAMVCVLPIQDWLATDPDLRRPDPDAETVNVPADRHHRWRYRLHLTTAELTAADRPTARLRRLVEASGRHAAPTVGTHVGARADR